MAAVLLDQTELVVHGDKALARFFAVAALKARGNPAINGLGLGKIAHLVRAIGFGGYHKLPEIMGRCFDLGGLAWMRLGSLDCAITPSFGLGRKPSHIPIFVQRLNQSLRLRE